MKIYRYLLIPISLILLLSTACAGKAATPTITVAPLTTATSTVPATQTPTPLATATPILTATHTPTPSPTEIPVYGLGQLVKINELELVMLKVEFVNKELVLTLAARNNGSTVQFMNSDPFDVIQEGNKDILWGGYTHPKTFYEALQPGDILVGTMGWNGVAADKKIRVTYHDQNKKVLATWEISQPGEAAVPPEIATTPLKSPLHQPGTEAILYKGFDVTLDKITITARSQPHDTYVKVYFTYENKGAGDVTIPMNLLGDIWVKTSNGEVVERNIDNITCASTNRVDIVLQPGKNFKQSFCYYTTGMSPQPGGMVIMQLKTEGGQFDFINWTIK